MIVKNKSISSYLCLIISHSCLAQGWDKDPYGHILFERYSLISLGATVNQTIYLFIFARN